MYVTYENLLNAALTCPQAVATYIQLAKVICEEDLPYVKISKDRKDNAASWEDLMNHLTNLEKIGLLTLEVTGENDIEITIPKPAGHCPPEDK